MLRAIRYVYSSITETHSQIPLCCYVWVQGKKERKEKRERKEDREKGKKERFGKRKEGLETNSDLLYAHRVALKLSTIGNHRIVILELPNVCIDRKT